MDPRTGAIRLLTHYLQTAFEAARLPWGSDNDAEVEGIVDCIIQAAKGDR